MERDNMKRLGIGLVATLVFLSLTFAAQKDETYSGEIMDSQCALLGGHEKMILKGEDLKTCTVRCVGIGGKYALFDTAKRMRYQLDDQKKAEQFAGMKVTVTGTYNAATRTIRVTDIKAAS